MQLITVEEPHEGKKKTQPTVGLPWETEIEKCSKKKRNRKSIKYTRKQSMKNFIIHEEQQGKHHE